MLFLRIGGGSKLYTYDEKHDLLYRKNPLLKKQITQQVYGVDIARTGEKMDRLKITVIKNDKSKVEVITNGHMTIADMLDEICYEVMKV